MIRTIHLTLFALLLPLANACGDDATGDLTDGAGGQTEAAGGNGPPGSALDPCPPDGAAEAPHTDIPSGIYSVPVPPNLASFASYPVDDITLCWTGSAVQLGYSLPAQLIGKKERVSFEGNHNQTTGSFELKSADGTASCSETSGQWTCEEVFATIAVDFEELNDELADLPANEAAGKYDVSQLFDNDPIGILDFSGPDLDI